MTRFDIDPAGAPAGTCGHPLLPALLFRTASVPLPTDTSSREVNCTRDLKGDNLCVYPRQKKDGEWHVHR